MATPNKNSAPSPRTHTYELVSLKVRIADPCVSSYRVDQPAHRYFTTQVEDKVYRVPRHGFIEHSEIFETMFTLPQPDGSSEGQSDENPIILPSCTKLEFESLLEVLYPAAGNLQVAHLQKGQWINVLKLSDLWSMEKIKQMAIDELDEARSLDAMEKVDLGREYRVSTWLITGYMSIVENWAEKHWTLNDLGDKLGWETAARILELVSKSKRPEKVEQCEVMVSADCASCPPLRKTVFAPMRKDVVICCEVCGRPVLGLKLSPPTIASSPFQSEALAKAVSIAFKDELSLCD
ncbi:hypothetical protein NMY22_g15080 [Coprinellus aureogranulatus]|nr:hypothetical protein NMY22_g15080 [Coprinellus aureogranulatus]